MFFCLTLSVVDRICVATFLAFVKDCATLIRRSGLDYVIFHLWMVAFRAFLLNYHLGLSSLLLFDLWFVLVQPFLVLLYLHVCTDRSSDELLKREGVLAYVAGNKTIDCVQIYQTTANRAEIGWELINVTHQVKKSVFY